MQEFVMTHARSGDPSTSKAAAESAEALSTIHKNIILRALREYGPSTKDELANLTDLNGTQIARRLPDLKKENLAFPTEETRPSESGRSERVWGAVR